MRISKAFGSLAFLAMALLATPAAADTFGFNDSAGFKDGRACDSAAATCDSESADFTAGPSHVSGTLDWDGVSSISFLLNATSPTYTGSYDGVTNIAFSNVSLSASNWFAADLGGTLTAFGPKVGTISGDYDQGDGSGPQAFSQSATFSNLTCLLITSIVCDFQVGTQLDWNLDVGTLTPASHDFIATFHLTAPEPNTAALLGLGLLSLAGARRNRD